MSRKRPGGAARRPSPASADRESEQPRDRGRGEPRRRPKSRRRKAIEIALQVALVLAVLVGASWWQARDLLPAGEPAPEQLLPTVDGELVRLGEPRGRPAVIYFFAPWCSVCDSASANVAALRAGRSASELDVYAVGLDYEREEEIARFADEHDLDVPVLLGNGRTRREYRVGSYPTIYLLDGEGRIVHRLVGYTTEIGLWLRLWLT